MLARCLTRPAGIKSIILRSCAVQTPVSLRARLLHHSTPVAAVRPFQLTDIGEGIAEVELLEVYVKPGDKVQQYDKLVSVASDKATVDISSPFEGTVTEISFKTGDVIKTGSTLLLIDVPDAAGAPSAAATIKTTPAAAPVAPQAASAEGIIKPFQLTDIGEGIAEVELLQVYVKPGDKIQQYDRLVEVQSDKATVDISSPYEGIVQEIMFKTGDVIKTGSTLLTVRTAGTAAEASPAAAAVASSTPAATAPSSSSQSVNTGKHKALATPAVRRIAKEHKIDIAVVPSTGPHGRVLKGDILAFIAGAPAKAAKASASPATVTAPAPAPVMPVAPAPSGKDTVVPVKGIQRAMGKSMAAAWTVPHFGYADEIVMDGLIDLRTELKGLASSRGIKFSYMPIILKATSLALKAFPQLNATTNDGATELTYRASHNICIAMDTPRGLLVPNIKNVQDRTLFEIAQELTRLQELGAAGKLGEADLTGGTFALSNIGAIGGTYMSPVLVVPQVVIGALGRVQRVPRFADDGVTVVPANIMNVSWSGDHRVVDGATMSRFSNLWKSYLEAPKKMLVDMK